jgi:hypothetical protein
MPMRWAPTLLCVLASCAADVRQTRDESGTSSSNSSDPGVDGGFRTDGGSSTTGTDARVPPPDGVPQGLAPCDEAPYHSDFTFLQDKVFTPSCAGCHDAASPGGGLVLEAGRAHGSLVNVTSSGHAGWVRVVPSDPGASMLLVQVGAEPGPELEGFMPWGDPQLCTPLLDAMRRWVAAGAPSL